MSWLDSPRDLVQRNIGNIAGRCEWCGAVNYQPHPDTGSKVVLTIAHVWDKRPEQASLLNLAALCQRCHLNWDRREHGFNRLRNRIARLMRQGQIPLCLPREDSLAMALYNELVRRGEISMPPQWVMQLGFPASTRSGSDRAPDEAQLPMLVRLPSRSLRQRPALLVVPARLPQASRCEQGGSRTAPGERLGRCFSVDSGFKPPAQGWHILVMTV